MTTLDVTLALDLFKKRKAANDPNQQINNSSLPAGSPMYYYCRCCGEHTETLPESHIRRPKTVCDPCKILLDHGVIDNSGRVKIAEPPPPITTSRFEHKEPL
jgi:hypothetical protein